MNKLCTTAIGIGLTLTLAGCGGGSKGAAPAAGLVQPTTTTIKLISKRVLVADVNTMCQAAGLAFGDLRTQAADLMDALADDSLSNEQSPDERAQDFLVNIAIPPMEKAVGVFRVAGVPNRDGREYAHFVQVLSDAMVEMKNETMAKPQDALKDLADGPDEANPDPTRAGEAFANADELGSTFGFKDCKIF